jgi:hypothetical protein
MSTRADFERFDRELASFGVPPLSPWWRDTVGRFFDAYDAGDALELWCCVGRGGAKSTALYKLALFQALLGQFTIPDDERHYAIVLSRIRAEAEKGLIIISGWLRKLGIACRAVGDTIDIDGMPRGIRVTSASVGAASGWRAFFVGCDEFAKWRAEGAADIDSDEVLSSARAMMATHPKGMVMVASSPWATEGTFYKAILQGDVPGRTVLPATPSWVANPLITEADTHKRESNDRRWRREYAAEFVDAFEAGFFPSEAIAACTDLGRLPMPISPGPHRGYVVAIDPAFSFDRFAVAIAHAEWTRAGPLVVVDYIGTVDPPARGVSLSPDRAVAAVSAIRRSWPGGAAVHSDQYAAASLQEGFLRRNVFLRIEPWTQGTKLERFTLARSLMVDARVRLPDCQATRKELSGFGLKFNPSGSESIVSRTAHDDRVSALVHAIYLAHARAPSYGRGGEGSTGPRTVPMGTGHRRVG